MRGVTWLAVVVVSTSCTPSLSLNTTPTTTSVGDPLGGGVTSAVIGPAGGTLTNDGLSLIIPPGAVASDTTFTATPISVQAPGGFRAWRLEPEGTTFSTAATITFEANPVLLAGSTPEALRIAYQKADRTWAVLTDATLSGSKVSAHTTHLSDWSALKGWQLSPGSATVSTQDTLDLKVQYCNFIDIGELSPLAASCNEQLDLTPILGNWSVNSRAGGDGTVGTIQPGTESAQYTSPKVAPESNPVAISVELNPGGITKQLLVANVMVGNTRTYAGKMTYSFKTGGISDAGVNSGIEEISYKGQGEFTLSADPAVGDDGYSAEGTFSVQELSLPEHGDCSCNGSGGSAAITIEAHIRADGTVRFSGSGQSFMAPISCMPLHANAMCVDAYPLTPGWGTSEEGFGCTLTRDLSYSDPDHITGSWKQTCGSKEESLTWQFDRG